MPMNYPGAGVAAPANGSDNSPTFFKGVFDYIFATYNATEPVIANTASAGVLRDTNKQINVGTIAVNPANAAFAGILVTGAASQSGFPYQYKLSGGADAFHVAADGGIVTAGSYTVGSTVVIDNSGGVQAAVLPTIAVNKGGTGATTAGAARTALGVPATDGTGATGTWTINTSGNAATATLAAAATALAAPVLLTALVSDYRPTTNASAGVVTIGAGGAYEDSNGAIVGPLAQQTATMPTQPTGTHFQYVGVTLAPATGAPVVTAAVVDAAISTLVLPTANKPVAVVLWKGATTLPTGVIAAADITNLNALGAGGAAAGGGGADSGVRSAAVLLNGTNAILPNGLDVSSSAAVVAIHPGLSRRAIGDSSFDDVQQAWVQPDILSAARLAKSAANAITLSATNTSPFSARNKKLTASSTAVASGATGARYAIFDTAIPGLVTPMPTTNALNPATQSQIGIYWWDNGNSVLQDGLLVDFSAVGQLPSNSIGKATTTASNAWTDTGTSGSLGVTVGDSGIVNFPVYTFYAPTQCRMDFITAIGIIYSMASVGSLVISVYLDGARVGKPWGINTSGTYTVPGPWTGRPIPISPGAHGINLAYNMVGASSTITFLAGFNEIIPTFWKG